MDNLHCRQSVPGQVAPNCDNGSIFKPHSHEHHVLMCTHHHHLWNVTVPPLPPVDTTDVRSYCCRLLAIGDDSRDGPGQCWGTLFSYLLIVPHSNIEQMEYGEYDGVWGV